MKCTTKTAFKMLAVATPEATVNVSAQQSKLMPMNVRESLLLKLNGEATNFVRFSATVRRNSTPAPKGVRSHAIILLASVLIWIRSLVQKVVNVKKGWYSMQSYTCAFKKLSVRNTVKLMARFITSERKFLRTIVKLVTVK